MPTDRFSVMVHMLDEIVRAAVPEAVDYEKYGGTLYSIKPDEKEGQFCGIFVFKNHVHLAISNVPGLMDADTTGILQGSGKTRKHINFESPDEIDAKTITPLLKLAAAD